jgi:oxygen-independent coproporphyrinogen-3 oxidase
MGASLDQAADSIYFGGGTPTLLTVEQLECIFVTIRQKFAVQPGAEITLECAPGTLSGKMLECFSRNGVSRMSLGVQSFIDQEARSVGRLHNRETVLSDIAHLRSGGISNINVDLIAGLPHQTRESWAQSLDELIATGVPHASVYMLEVDEDSRLGRELIAGGQKYHAHFVPDEDLVADMYEVACERLKAAGIQQYEISNFARPGFESKHNLKYWTRQPYLGFGVDAHSMLLANARIGARNLHSGPGLEPSKRHNRQGHDFQSFRTQPRPMDGTAESRALPNATRFCNPDNLESYLSASPIQQTVVTWEVALQETCFLGLRLSKGLDLERMTAQFERDALDLIAPTIEECLQSGLMEREGNYVRLTAKGRLLSNEVFEQFITEPVPLSS